jgi:hypothetical protein
MREALKRLIADIKADDFYAAHENLEHYWREIKKRDHPLKNLIKGYINGATAFELIKRGKIDAAKRVWATYEKYLPLLKEDMECYELFKEADTLLRKLKEERLH